MTRVNYSSEQAAQIDQLKNYVEDYCQSNGIDPKIYTNYLDGNQTTLDPKIRNDPVFQAYWQLAYLQLNEIVNPTPLQSQSSEVGEVNFDKLYASVDSQTNDLITKILADDPELMGFAAQTHGESPLEVLSLLNQKTPPPAVVSENGGPIKAASKASSGSFLDWLQSSQEGMASVEEWAMQGMSDLDAYVASLKDMMETGKIDPAQAQVIMQDKMASREMYTYFIQQANGRMNQQLEFFSALLKSLSDNKNNLLHNLVV